MLFHFLRSSLYRLSHLVGALETFHVIIIFVDISFTPAALSTLSWVEGGGKREYPRKQLNAQMKSM